MNAARTASSDAAVPVAVGWTDCDLDPSAAEHSAEAIAGLGFRHAIINGLPLPTATLSPTALPAGLTTRTVIPAPPAPSAALLRDLASQGVCGVRFTLTGDTEAARAEMESVLRYADRVVPFGWHIELALDAGAVLTPHEWTLMRLPVAVCLSGVAELVARHGLDDPEIGFLLDLLRIGRSWIRLPGRVPAGDDDAFRALVGTMATIRPDRLVWGSGAGATPAGNGAGHITAALATLARWLPDAALRAAVLGTNPARFLGFGSPDRAAVAAEAAGL